LQRLPEIMLRKISKISFKVMSPRDVYGTKVTGVWLTEKK